jgi:adenosylcobinamide-GDP ribazoletransferase
VRAILVELQLALMLLTRLPAGRLSYAPSIGQSAWAFPVIGLLVGAIAASVMTALTGLDPHLAAGLTVAATVLVTGGLHEDGLADLADGFGGGRDKARKLEIMRDSRIGSYGTLALILVLGLRVQAIALVAGQGSAVWALIAIEAASRAGLPLVLRRLPAARADGLGHGAAQVSWRRVGIALVLGIASLSLIGGMAAVWIGITISLVVAAISLLALRQIGGQTGDVLGAMQALSACAAWIVLSAIL